MKATVLPAKSDSDVVFCLQLLSKTLTYTLHLMRIDRSLMYLSYPVDMINTQVIYRFLVTDNCVNITSRHCHSWLAGK